MAIVIIISADGGGLSRENCFNLSFKDIVMQAVTSLSCLKTAENNTNGFNSRLCFPFFIYL